MDTPFKFALRPAKPQDSLAIAPLMEKLGYPFEPTNLAAQITNHIQNPNGWCFLLEIEGKIIGFISMVRIPYFHKTGNFLRVTSLFILENFRKRGLGRALLDKAQEIAQENNCDKIEVTSGNHRQNGAHGFYETLGFEKYEGIRFLKPL